MKKKELRTTEKESLYRDLEKMPLKKLLRHINEEDQKVPAAVKKCIPEIEKLVKQVVKQMKDGGRLFYLGAGTSGRLGVVDASECPPTFGVPPGLVTGLIAGGDGAIRRAVEFAEDDPKQGFKDLLKFKISNNDFVIGIAASGTTPYVAGALAACRKKGIGTGCIVCNKDTPVAKEADYKIECVTGPEFVTGSTRMKAGTAQKLILNMISTSVMIQLGRVEGNRMVDMQLTNHKLVDRGVRMIMERLKVNADQASRLLEDHGSVRKVILVAGKSERKKLNRS
jgi:N-acetylmuramic acid 6-phosphate etherase